MEYLSSEYKRKEAKGEKHNSDFASMMMANEISEEKAGRKVSITFVGHFICSISYGRYHDGRHHDTMIPLIQVETSKVHQRVLLTKKYLQMLCYSFLPVMKLPLRLCNFFGT